MNLLKIINFIYFNSEIAQYYNLRVQVKSLKIDIKIYKSNIILMNLFHTHKLYINFFNM